MLGHSHSRLMKGSLFWRKFLHCGVGCALFRLVLGKKKQFRPRKRLQKPCDFLESKIFNLDKSSHQKTIKKCSSIQAFMYKNSISSFSLFLFLTLSEHQNPWKSKVYLMHVRHNCWRLRSQFLLGLWMVFHQDVGSPRSGTLMGFTVSKLYKFLKLGVHFHLPSPDFLMKFCELNAAAASPYYLDSWCQSVCNKKKLDLAPDLQYIILLY